MFVSSLHIACWQAKTTKQEELENKVRNEQRAQISISKGFAIQSSGREG
jgi:hypothetical protein